MDIVITHETQMLISKILLLATCSIISWYIAFRQTPELDGVKNAWIYRVSYGMLILRGLAFTFTTIGLLPIE